LYKKRIAAINEPFKSGFFLTGTVSRKKSNKPAVVGEYEIDLKGRKIRYILKRSHKARLVWLKIGPRDGLSVTIPSFYKPENLPEYLIQRSDWILQNLEKYCSAVETPESLKPVIPEKIFILGKCYVLKTNNRAKGFTAISLDDSTLSFNLSSSFGGSDKQGLKMWLKDQAKRIINEKVKVFSRKIQVIYNRVYIREQKSIWGSCSTRKNLSFNWRLIMVPESVIDYVIIHELCHLKEMNHSKGFWKLVEDICPDWRIRRKWLNEHCYELKATLPEN
jgi:predicted metal-dependent hydrolase